MYRMMILSVLIIALLSGMAMADPITVNWAGTYWAGSTPPNNPQNALHRPDGLAADFSPDAATAAFGDFGDTESLDAAQFAAFLGVSASLIHEGSIIVFEGNGTAGIGFEHSTWRFNSGGVEEVLAIPADAAASGAITLSAYKAFFGIGLDLSHVAEWPFVIIELNTVDALAPDLTVTVTREDPPNGTPDPDAIGILGSLHVVPVETTTWGAVKSLYRE